MNIFRYPITLLTLAGAAFLWTGSGLAQRAQADAPYDDRQAALARQVLAKGRKADASLPLLRMSRYARDVDPDVSRALFQRIADRRGLRVEHPSDGCTPD